MFAGLVRRSDRCLVSSRSIAAQIAQDNMGSNLANNAEVRSGMKMTMIEVLNKCAGRQFLMLFGVSIYQGC